MKKSIYHSCIPLILLFSGICQTLLGQSFVSDFIIDDRDFRIEITEQSKGYEAIVTQGDSSDTIEFHDLSIEVFSLKFLNAVSGTKFFTTTPGQQVLAEIQSNGQKIFYKFYVASSVQKDEGPRAGFLRINKEFRIFPKFLGNIYHKIQRKEKQLGKINRENRFNEIKNEINSLWNDYYKVKNSTESKYASFSVDSLSLEIYNGSIRNLIVHGCKTEDSVREEDKKKISTYRNLRPIGIASFSDIEAMADIRLYNLHDPYNSYSLELSSLMQYNPNLNLKTDDYSPKDSVYTIKPDKNGKFENIEVLYKEKSQYLFIGRIYTDLVGLNEGEPNGLIQTEFSKRIIVNSQESWINAINYLDVSVVLSKLEENDRTLQLESNEANALEVFQYSFANIQCHLNILKIDIPKYRFNISNSFDMGLLFTQFSVDSSDVFNKSSFALGNTTIVEFTPDFRWGIDLRYSYLFVELFDSSFETKFQNIYAIELNGFWKPNPKKYNEVFYRTGVYFDDRRRDFFRLQIGYSFPLLKK